MATMVPWIPALLLTFGTTGDAGATGCPELRLTFAVDRDYDARHLYTILHGDDPAGFDSRAASLEIDRGLAKAIHEASSYASVRERIEAAVASRYAAIGRDLARGRSAYEIAWAPLVREFSDRMTLLIGHCWIQPGYRVVVSAFQPGLSNWHGDTVAARFDLNFDSKCRIVAHEIVLSQLFQLVRRRFPQEAAGDWSVWAFSEITAALLLDDPSLRRNWPRYPSEGYFARSNYPQLAPLEAELRRRFRVRPSFDEYVSDALSLLVKQDRARLLGAGAQPRPPP
ncbi:MAG: hypothetical protein ACYDCL_00390 [Myxococcales bacterium]